MSLTPVCKKCKVDLHWDGFASMGSSHSNWYICPKCGQHFVIADEDLNKKTLEV
jgi:hypothetical protein